MDDLYSKFKKMMNELKEKQKQEANKDKKILNTDLSLNKSVKSLKRGITNVSLTLNFLSIIANKVGNETNLYMEAVGNRAFSAKDAAWARLKLKNVFDEPKIIGFLYKSGVLNTKNKIQNNNKSLSISSIINGYDKVNGMFIQHFLEKDFTNRVALMLAKNHTIKNGKIVKITDATSEKNLIDLGELNEDEYKLPVSDAEIGRAHV